MKTEKFDNRLVVVKIESWSGTLTFVFVLRTLFYLRPGIVLLLRLFGDHEYVDSNFCTTFEKKKATAMLGQQMVCK
jgi:hypothetical protein